MASVDELEALATRWLKKNRGKLSLQRTLYLVPGLQDENAGCWTGTDSVTDWGARVFNNWSDATVRVIQFPVPYPRPLDSFFDFGDDVRAIIAGHHPDSGSGIGEYDLVGHSMGGLDGFAALIDDCDATRPAPPVRIARAYNFVAFDTPWRGVPNIEARRLWAEDFRQRQCDALTADSAQLSCVAAAADRLPERADRITCYGAAATTQVEVDSANLYPKVAGGGWRVARERASYRFIRIPGTTHSGAIGVTTSVIAIANLFDTLTTRLPASRKRIPD